MGTLFKSREQNLTLAFLGQGEVGPFYVTDTFHLKIHGSEVQLCFVCASQHYYFMLRHICSREFDLDFGINRRHD